MLSTRLFVLHQTRRPKEISVSHKISLFVKDLNIEAHLWSSARNTHDSKSKLKDEMQLLISLEMDAVRAGFKWFLVMQHQNTDFSNGVY